MKVQKEFPAAVHVSGACSGREELIQLRWGSVLVLRDPVPINEGTERTDAETRVMKRRGSRAKESRVLPWKSMSAVLLSISSALNSAEILKMRSSCWSGNL